MLLRMIGQIKESGERFRCVFVVFLDVAKVFSESVAQSSPWKSTLKLFLTKGRH